MEFGYDCKTMFRAPYPGDIQIPCMLTKLYIFTHYSSESDYDIIQWDSQGKQINITCIKRFEEEILATYFRSTKISSFIRGLHLYGFYRVDSGGNPWGFAHKLFLRGRWDLLPYIIRKTNKRLLHKITVPSEVSCSPILEDLDPPPPEYHINHPLCPRSTQIRNTRVAQSITARVPIWNTREYRIVPGPVWNDLEEYLQKNPQMEV